MAYNPHLDDDDLMGGAGLGPLVAPPPEDPSVVDPALAEQAALEQSAAAASVPDVAAYMPDQRVLDAIRAKRDADVNLADLSGAFTTLGAGIAGQKADMTPFESAKKVANLKAEEGLTDAKMKSAAVANYIKNKAALSAAKKSEGRWQATFDQKEREIKAIAGQKAADKADKKAEKAAEKADKDAKETQELSTQFGVANTLTDAKEIKESAEKKAAFDSKLDEMIALRKEFGAEMADRTAVERGKQLSNELLVLYKDLAKLGVMSASDEKILRSVIPADPLEYNVSSSVPLFGKGQKSDQDPTMNRMKKFKGDAERDFQAKIKNRIRGGGKTVVRTQRSPSTGKVKVTYSDGTSEIK